MKKKLLLLDLVLLALVTVVALRVRDAWLEARKRESVVLGQRIKQAPAPPFAPLPVIEPPAAVAYAEIAQKMLFSADRNPTVVIEAVPEKPMPPLPRFYGAMDIGTGTTAFMSEKPGAPTKKVKYGEKVGEFTLVALNREEIVLEWEKKQIVKKVHELLDRSEAAAPPQASSAPPARAAAAPAQALGNLGSAAASSGPSMGVDMGAGYRACNPGDKSPAGTVLDGYKKVITASPFGSVCRWEKIN